jgi:transcriptional regulator with XRE-family HTH domain
MGTWLRNARRARQWDVTEMARQLRCAAPAGSHLPALRSLRRMIRGWEAGEHVVSERYRLLYATALGMDASGPLEVPVPGEPACLPRALPGAAGLLADVVGMVMAAAHESSSRAAADGGQVVPAASIEQVRADVGRLAHSYSVMPPVAFLADARRTRDLAFWLVERTHRPAQAADLYLALGQVCGLMSVASFDLAVWPAAIEQAHAAYVYADLAGHRSLQAWARGVEALNAYWCGRPREAVDLAEAGLARAPDGIARARLHSILARAWSCLGAVDRTRAALAAADQAREFAGEAGTDDLHDGVSGEFGWGPARQAMCLGSALLGIGDPKGAAGRAAEAIRLRPEDHTGSLVDMTARADLASAELARGRLDAAGEALAPVWGLAPSHRRHSLVKRLDDLAGALVVPRFAKTPGAVVLAERIEVFAHESAPRSLPAGPVVPESE